MRANQDNSSVPLRTAIDARSALRRHPAGIGRYAIELVTALTRLEFAPTLYWNPGEDEPNAPEVVCADANWHPIPGRRAWMTLHVPLRLWRHRADVFHVPDGVPPYFAPCPSVVTVFDLSVVDHPEWYPLEQAEKLQHGMGNGLHRATRLIAISEFTRSRLQDYYGIAAEKIDVTPLAPSSTARPITDPSKLAEIRQRYGLEEGFILHVGAIQPRKNLARLVEAHALAFAGQSQPPQLVLAGPPGWRNEEIMGAIDKSALQSRIKIIGYVPQDDLPALYSAASCLAYPSLYEGFGIPPLEAMACGTPVVTSNTTSLPEVVGEAALSVHPEGTEALAEALKQLVEDKELREELRQRGFQQAAQFSWERTAALTWKTYERAAAGGGR